VGQAAALMESSDRAATRYMPRWNNIPVTDNGDTVYHVPYTFSASIGTARICQTIRCRNVSFVLYPSHARESFIVYKDLLVSLNSK